MCYIYFLFYVELPMENFNLLHRLFSFGPDSCTFTVLKSKVCASVFINTLQPYADKVSSVSIPGLQGSQQYCVMVQYTLFNMSVGPPSCIHCELIPESSKNVYCLFFTRPSIHTHARVEPAAFHSSGSHRRSRLQVNAAPAGATCPLLHLIYLCSHLFLPECFVTFILSTYVRLACRVVFVEARIFNQQ